MMYDGGKMGGMMKGMGTKASTKANSGKYGTKNAYGMQKDYNKGKMKKKAMQGSDVVKGMDRAHRPIMAK